MKYRKKPVVIEAFKYDGPKCLITMIKGNKLPCFISKALESGDLKLIVETETSDLKFTVREKLIIETLEGVMAASVGDYIIQGVNGELYPCKPDIFEKTYEKVEVEEETN